MWRISGERKPYGGVLCRFTGQRDEVHAGICRTAGWQILRTNMRRDTYRKQLEERGKKT